MPEKAGLVGLYLTILGLIVPIVATPPPVEKSLAYYEAARNHFKDRRVDEAISKLQQALAINPRHAPS